MAPEPVTQISGDRMTPETGALAHDGVPQGDVRESVKLRQILDGARRVFLADGFDGASMNDIAREAGVSKGTLYVYFDSKVTLFVALIREDHKQQAERICGFDESAGDPAEVLRKFGRSLLEKMTTADSIAHIRTVIGIAGKFPEVGKAFYEAGPCYGTEKLGAYLARQAVAGHYEFDDPRQAAWHFMQLCQGELFKKRLFGACTTAPEDEIARTVEDAVNVFERAFGRRQRPSAISA